MDGVRGVAQPPHSLTSSGKTVYVKKNESQKTSKSTAMISKLVFIEFTDLWKSPHKQNGLRTPLMILLL